MAAEVITPDQYREITNTHVPENKRAADLVGYVQNKVLRSPQCYHAFTGALRSDLSQYGDILGKLECSFTSHALTTGIYETTTDHTTACTRCDSYIMDIVLNTSLVPIPSFHAEIWVTLKRDWG